MPIDDIISLNLEIGKEVGDLLTELKLANEESYPDEVTAQKHKNLLFCIKKISQNSRLLKFYNDSLYQRSLII